LSIFPLQITPELIRSLKAFMARSSERDAVNDEARFSAVERSIDLALKSLDGEKRGLIGRVKRTVVGPPSASPQTVATADTHASAFEQAEVRIRALEQQIRMFQRMKAVLEEGRSPVGS
jgi:hypothetical protein